MTRLGGSVRARTGRILFCVIVTTFFALPLVAIVGASFTTTTYWSFPPEGWTFEWYETVLGNPEFSQSLLISLAVGALAAFLGLVLGFMAAYVAERAPGRVRPTVVAVAILPVLLPNVAIGLAIYQGFLAADVPINLLSLALAQQIIVLPFTITVLMVALRGVDESLERAAYNLGAGPWQVVRLITIPLIAPTAVVAGVLAFVISFDDTAIALFVNSPDVLTVPVRLLLWIDTRSGPAIAAAGSLVLAMGILLVAIVAKVGGVDALRRRL